MTGSDYKSLRLTRWLVMLSCGLTFLYVLGSAFLIYAWSPYEACRAGRCYMAHNWSYVIETFGPWHLTWLTVSGTLFYFVKQWQIPKPYEQPNHYQKWLMHEEDPAWDVIGQQAHVPEWTATDIQVRRHLPNQKD